MNRHLFAMMALGTCAVALAVPASAQAATFDIPPGALSASLNRFAHQSGRQMVYKADDIRNVRSAGVRGRMSADEALQALLSGTGFSARSDRSGAVAIVREAAPRPQASLPPAEQQGAAAPLPETPPAEATATEVVVTGSRISRRDYQSDSPISTVSNAQLASVGQPSLDKAIGQLPQFQAAQGASEVGDVQGGVGFSGGQSYSDLRGLGPNRSLVLLDGRRLMPSSPEGTIDLNTVPTPLIESVEVITGGASSTYGSDAIAGVVNFKLRQRFNGVELFAQNGLTTGGDGATHQISGIAGHNLGSRGNVVVALEYSDRDLVQGSTRPFFANIRQLGRPAEGIIAAGNFGGGSTGYPSIAAVNAVLARYPGTTPIAGTGNYVGAIGVNTDQTLFTTAAGANCVQNYKGVNGVLGANISANCTTAQVALGQYFGVQVPLTKYNVFARGNYQVADNVTVYGQFNYMNSEATDQTGPGSSKASLPLVVPQNNPYVTGNAALQTILNSITPRPTGNIIVTKLLSAFGNRVETFQYAVYQGLAGVRGQLPGTRINYDLYGSYGRSRFVNVNYGDVSRAAIATVLNGTANYSGPAGTCIGYAWNPLGNNPLSPGCLEYTRRNDTSVNTMSQKVVEGTLEGPIFTLPAGELRFALGGDYRDLRFKYRPSATLVANDSLSYGAINAASGRQTVYEAFGELLVPLLRDKPFAKELSLDLGYRYSHYNQSGDANTYKIDGTYAPVDLIRFRGSYSRAIRAPSLANLYGPISNGQLNIGTPPNAGDPCSLGSNLRNGANAAQVQALCIAQGVPAGSYQNFNYVVASVSGTDGSNPNLIPEKATTYSFGAVLTPKFQSALFHTFNLSVDYYNIKIDGAIGSLLLTDILPRCFNSDGASNPTYSNANPYCQRITRSSLTGEIVLGQQGLFNFATYTVDGIDTQLNWRFGLDALGLSPNAGSLQFDTIVAYLRTYKVAGLLGSPTLNYAGSAGFGGVGGGITHPTWKANTSLTYARGPLSITGRWRYIDRMIHSDRVASPAATTPSVPVYNYFDASASLTVTERLTFSGGVNNIGNKAPPFISAAPLTTDAATYDVIGRSFYVSVKAKF